MEDRLLMELAGRYGTPLYVYDGDIIRSRCREFSEAFKDFPAKVRCCYAVKANTNLAILSLIRKEGYGADVVSAGELDAALKAGFRPQDIIYTSNGKSETDMTEAVAAGINITADNAADVELLKRCGGKAIAFRVNPEVDAKTHPKISTALKGTKFGLHIEGGLAYDAVKKAKDWGLKVTGIHCHIGSNIKDADAFTQAGRKMIAFAKRLKDGLGIELEFIDFGGGLGISYNGERAITPSEFAQAYRQDVSDGVKSLGYKPEVWFEPGRFLVGEAGTLLTRALSVKETPAKRFINVDAGFNCLIRPAMYDAYHKVRILGKRGEEETYDVAGPLCESGDILGKDRSLPKAAAGDVVAIENAGAYGYSMSSNYNSMPLPAEVLLRGGKAELVRERQRVEELYIRQKVPKDLL